MHAERDLNWIPDLSFFSDRDELAYKVAGNTHPG
jgi:hypothetical protein